MTIAVNDIVLGYGGDPVVRGVTLAPEPGRITGIVGPNGCGKSTLLKGMIGLLKPTSGNVVINGVPLANLAPRQVAQAVAMLPQAPLVPEGITVGELVSRGRHPHQGLFTRFSAADDEAVAEALHDTNTADLADELVTELSGGQRQRVWIAMVLAQQTDVLLLDEPTTFLDLAHQVEVALLVQRLARDMGLTIVQVLHDLAMAARWSDHLVAMRDGVVLAEGAPGEVVTSEVIKQAFGLDARVITDEPSGTPLVIPEVHHG